MRSSTFSRLGLVLAVSFALLVTVGCSTNQSVGEQIDDATITTKIKAKLAGDGDVNPFNVDVDTDDGVVRLSGVVEKPEARSEAVRIARETKGVKRVVNDITIGERTLGERIDDTVIVTKIKAKLTGDSDVSPVNVDVDSKEGVVTLSGRVESVEARQEAERMARSTRGVREVHNRIKVISDDR